MHPSPAFRVEDEAVLLAHLAARPFVTLAAVVEGRPVVAHAPVVVRRLADGLALDFHLSRGNALAPALAVGFRAVAVSLGPEAYVSPDWYDDKDQVPTWNYVSVEAEGPVMALDDVGLSPCWTRCRRRRRAACCPSAPGRGPRCRRASSRR